MSEHREHSSSSNVTSKTIDNINPEELAELREAFRIYDQNDDVSKSHSSITFI